MCWGRHRVHRSAGVLGLIALAAAVPSRASEFDISQIFALDAEHSYVGFQIKYMGFAKVRGRFPEVSGAIRYDATDPPLTSATVRIAVASLDTDNDWRDKDLKSDQWFDADTYPAMTFRSTRAVATDAGFDLVGDLTIRDVTREIRLEMDEFSGVIQDIRADSQVVFVGHAALDRKEFGVKGDRWSQVKEGIVGVDSQVEIELTVLGKRINAPNFRNWVRDLDKPQGKVYAVVAADGVDAGLAAFDSLRAADPQQVSERVLDTVGYMLLKEGRTDDAVTVFRHNCRSFPAAPELHASLAEAYAAQGNLEQAKASYEIVLHANPDDVTAAEVIRHLP
jgi:polyisoprenoid-binding protein YceI